MKNQIEINEKNIDLILNLHCVLQDPRKVSAWLTTKNLNFGGFKPIDLINKKKAARVYSFCLASAIRGEWE